MQSCHFYSRYMQIGHSHIQSCIFEHATAFTHSCNCEFDIFNSVNVATQACILQNVLLNLVLLISHLRIQLECLVNKSVTPIHVSRYLYMAPFRRNRTDNLQVYKCKVDQFVEFWQDHIWETGGHFRRLTKIYLAQM